MPCTWSFSLCVEFIIIYLFINIIIFYLRHQTCEFADKNKNYKSNDLSGDTLWLQDMDIDKRNGEEN